MPEQVVIIGSGPAGHTAALYTARANLQPVMFEGFAAGGIPGGQLMITTEVENYPGFPEGIQGPELMEAFRKQSLRFETRIFTEDVIKVNLSKRPFTVASAERELTTGALIIASGATAKRLNVPGDERLWQKGISACAVCDGALPLFRNKVLVVVGGGDSAVEESTYLTKFASKVIVMVRRDALRAAKVMQDRLFANKKIEIKWNTIPVEFLGSNAITGVKVKDVKTGKESILEAGGFFYAIGHIPNTSFLNGQLALDQAGYIKTQPGTTKTNIEGVFACGDV